jgi:hypothetical protein
MKDPQQRRVLSQIKTAYLGIVDSMRTQPVRRVGVGEALAGLREVLVQAEKEVRSAADLARNRAAIDDMISSLLRGGQDFNSHTQPGASPPMVGYTGGFGATNAPPRRPLPSLRNGFEMRFNPQPHGLLSLLPLPPTPVIPPHPGEYGVPTSDTSQRGRSLQDLDAMRWDPPAPTLSSRLPPQPRSQEHSGPPQQRIRRTPGPSRLAPDQTQKKRRLGM